MECTSILDQHNNALLFHFVRIFFYRKLNYTRFSRFFDSRYGSFSLSLYRLYVFTREIPFQLSFRNTIQSLVLCDILINDLRFTMFTFNNWNRGKNRMPMRTRMRMRRVKANKNWMMWMSIVNRWMYVLGVHVHISVVYNHASWNIYGLGLKAQKIENERVQFFSYCLTCALWYIKYSHILRLPWYGNIDIDIDIDMDTDMAYFLEFRIWCVMACTFGWIYMIDITPSLNVTHW